MSDDSKFWLGFWALVFSFVLVVIGLNVWWDLREKGSAFSNGYCQESRVIEGYSPRILWVKCPEGKSGV